MSWYQFILIKYILQYWPGGRRAPSLLHSIVSTTICPLAEHGSSTSSPGTTIVSGWPTTTSNSGIPNQIWKEKYKNLTDYFVKFQTWTVALQQQADNN